MTSTDTPAGQNGPTEEVIWVELPSSPPKKKRRPRVATPPPSHPSIPELIAGAVEDVKAFITAQLEIVKIKATESAKSMAVGIALLVFAALLGLNLLWWVFHTIEMVFVGFLAPWAASLITAGILLVLLIIFALVGALLLKRAKDRAPNPVAMFKQDAEAVKEGLEK